MKTLLLIIFLVIALNCQGQPVDFKDVPEVKEMNKRISQLEAGRSVQISVLKGLFNQMLSHIDSLEKRIIALENNCLVTKADSTIGGFKVTGISKDSSYVEGEYTYYKSYSIVPFKSIKK